MTRSAWWKYLWLWLLPTVLTVLNGLWLGGLRAAVLGRGAEVVARVREKEQQVKELERSVADLLATKTKLAQLREDLRLLRFEQMGSMRQRLVPFLLEVGERAQKNGLLPERISYAARQDSKSGLVHFTATYEVSGSYEQLRQYMADLEQMPQFVVIERLALRGDEQVRATDISLQMVVGTYFSDWDPALLERLGVEEAGRAAE
ncbi:MAG: type 4a pilus biogenesis protein PilO [Thermoanaerobaculum sp.]|nr:type 4a pilus biogenesis protein PilO [Thermoanaerobaculum sp.]